MVKAIIWASQGLQSVLRERLAIETMIVANEAEFLAIPRDASVVSFVDGSTVGPATSSGVANVVAICEDRLQAAVSWLSRYPLSQIVSDTMLQDPMASDHLKNVIATLTHRQRRLLDWIPAAATGRRVRLAHASKRGERIEKMAEYLESNGVASRTAGHLRDAAEELLTNAFYNAPVAAGAHKQAIPRTQDVTLSEDVACDLAYAVHEDVALVCVRDRFGSLDRTRLLQVLSRCASEDMNVEVDPTMGGAGLGLWRIFTVASFVAVSVVEGHHTEFLVGIKRGGRGKPYGVHLFWSVPGGGT